jgi:hypothetical protein
MFVQRTSLKYAIALVTIVACALSETDAIKLQVIESRDTNSSSVLPIKKFNLTEVR